MENYVDLNYSDSNYVDGDIIVVDGATDCAFVESLNSTLTLLFQKIQSIEIKLSSIDTQIVNGIDGSTIDISPLTGVIDNLLTNSIQNMIADASLNGYGSEFKDGDSVIVSGRDVTYVVQRSFFSIYSENAYTIHYDIKSLDGQRLIVPEALLTKTP